MAVPTFPLVNAAFFIRNINIPNASTEPTAQRLTSFITKYEAECLLGILGYPLYKVFLTEDTPRMTALLTGEEYTDDLGKLRKWYGLLNTTTHISLLANYIYYFYQEANATQSTGVNTKVPKAEAGLAVSPADKMINAWNFFSEQVGEISSFLWMRKDAGERVYTEFDSTQWYKNKVEYRRINGFDI